MAAVGLRNTASDPLPSNAPAVVPKPKAEVNWHCPKVSHLLLLISGTPSEQCGDKESHILPLQSQLVGTGIFIRSTRIIGEGVPLL